MCVDVGMKEKESGVGEGSTLRVIADSKDATQSLQRGPVARLENTTRDGLKSGCITQAREAYITWLATAK